MRIGDAIGLDIGGTKIAGVRVDPSGKIVAKKKIPTSRDLGPADVTSRAARLARELAAGGDGIAALGVGFAGLVDRKSGVVSSSIMLPGWDDFPLAAHLRAAINAPTFALNDAKAAGFGEFAALGSPQGLDMCVLTVGTGIGGALILDGRLHFGNSGFAGEIGNATIDYRGGKRCWCGQTGCLNTSASGTAIAEHAAALADLDGSSILASLPRPLRLESVAEAARGGDRAASRAIADGAAALGAGIANVVQIVDPTRIALTGGVIEIGDAFVRLVRQETKSRLFREMADRLTIERCILGDDTGAFGAAMWARECTLLRRGSRTSEYSLGFESGREG